MGGERWSIVWVFFWFVMNCFNFYVIMNVYVIKVSFVLLDVYMYKGKGW